MCGNLQYTISCSASEKKSVVGMFRTYTSDSISRISHLTRAVERSFGVSAVGISMAVVRVFVIVF